MGDDKRDEPRTGPAGGPLIDPDSFWSDAADEESTEDVVTAPNLSAPPPGAMKPAEDDDDVAVVGSAAGAPRPGRLPPRPKGPPRRQSRPMAPPPNQPRTPRPKVAGLPPPRAQPAPFNPPVPVRPAGEPTPPAAAGSPSGVIVSEGPQLWRILLMVFGVAALSAFLGWFLIGRHAGQEAAEAEEIQPVEENGPGEEDAANRSAAAAHDDGPGPELVKPAAVETKATIQIKSDPAEAAVFIDDEQRGLTPTVITDLDAAGEITIRIEKAGYKPWIQTIELDEKDPDREIDAGLVALSKCKSGTAYLYVHTQPAGATVTINGKRMPGKTPKVINDVCATESLEVLVQAAGRRAWKERLVLEPDEIRNLNLNLEK